MYSFEKQIIGFGFNIIYLILIYESFYVPNKIF
jgi:hypothetical protein